MSGSVEFGLIIPGGGPRIPPQGAAIEGAVKYEASAQGSNFFRTWLQSSSPCTIFTTWHGENKPLSYDQVSKELFWIVCVRGGQRR